MVDVENDQTEVATSSARPFKFSFEVPCESPAVGQARKRVGVALACHLLDGALPFSQVGAAVARQFHRQPAFKLVAFGDVAPCVRIESLKETGDGQNGRGV